MSRPLTLAALLAALLLAACGGGDIEDDACEPRAIAPGMAAIPPTPCKEATQ
jgi:hypothetical protein